MQEAGGIIVRAANLTREAVPLLRRSAGTRAVSIRSPRRSRGSRAERTSFTGWSERRRQAPGVVFRAGSVQHSVRQA